MGVDRGEQRVGARRVRLEVGVRSGRSGANLIAYHQWVRTAKLVLLLDGTSARDTDLGGDG